ncbi:MAG: SWIM zinc finger family protein [Verrucomicrobiae bacterium]|nr:SWIM zinc finger family protein [Verrucomicrobiae bacterium]
MSWYSFRPYVSVAQRRREAEQTARKMARKGTPLNPVVVGRTIARTFWGESWCDNLEAYSDYANRLPRGRTYVRNGSVIDLQVGTGTVKALVQGSSLYRIEIGIAALDRKRWIAFRDRCAGKVTNLLDLLQGRLSKEILRDIAAPGQGLFPSPKEIRLSCSCPDWAVMCKHVAAALYGIGARLDEQPELFFTLRGVDMRELLAAATEAVAAPRSKGSVTDPTLAGEDLGAIFGVELETGTLMDGAVAATKTATGASGTGRRKTPRSVTRRSATRGKPGAGAGGGGSGIGKAASAGKPGAAKRRSKVKAAVRRRVPG